MKTKNLLNVLFLTVSLFVAQNIMAQNSTKAISSTEATTWNFTNIFGPNDKNLKESQTKENMYFGNNESQHWSFSKEKGGLLVPSFQSGGELTRDSKEGIINFILPAGKGTITVKGMGTSSRFFCVKVGKTKKSMRGTKGGAKREMSIDYNGTEETQVFIYGNDKAGNKCYITEISFEPTK
jgi:hypothetical protein